MRDSDLLVPGSIDEVVRIIGETDSLLVAGGTSMSMLLKEGVLDYDHLVWIGRLEGLRGVSATPAGEVALGALTTLAEVAASPIIRQRYPMVARAAGVVANPRIRAIATVGGTLAHADPRQDLPPALLAAGAEVDVIGPQGPRTIGLRDGFFQGFLETAVEPDELLTAVRLPAVTAGARQEYLRFTPDSADDYPTVSVAACLVEGGDPGVWLALGGVAPTALFLREAAATVPGRMPSYEDVRGVADLAREASAPTDDERGSPEYKAEMARVCTERVLRALTSARA